jgi:Tol biopolymer transport system component
VTPERLSQIEELYHLAREREPGQRAAFLAGACQDDEDLRREVESLLASEPSGACFLDEPVMRQAAGTFASQQSSSQLRFAPGLELGPYVIEAHLGAGGMGEVYRAKDKRLHRTVALKVLPKRLADTLGLRQRLEREAKAISSLNHPHICTLYDIGRQGEIDYLVMEFLEGDTLAQRLKRGALPLSEVLELAIQIASALAAAHAAGIVHRDLKPGNIMLTKSGAKLLDFGLAKVRAAEALAGAAMSSPAEPITTTGTVVGTAQYMSPEQIQGREADARSDLFAFGATLYEMLTGKRAFAGQSQFAVVSAILEKEPEPVRDLQPLTPPALERVVRRCLAKDPEKRWQNTSDLESELRWIVEASGTRFTAAGSEAVARGRKRELLYGALAVIFLLAAILSAASHWRLARTPARAISSEITPPDKVRFISYIVGGEPRLSPDGRALAFSGADENGKTMLWVRSLDSREARALPGTDEALDPFWSADSRKIGFFAGGKMKSIEAEGGPVVEVADGCPNEGGGSWNRDGTILFVPDEGALYKVTGAGAHPLPVLANDPHKVFVKPRFLPDGKHFLIASDSPDPAARGMYFASLDGRESRLVLGGNLLAIYASGFLLYVQGNTLMAQAFEPERGQLKGDPPQRVVDRVERAGGYFANTMDAAENGILIYRTIGEFDQKRLTWFDRTGKNLGITGEVGSYWDVRLSPDGQKLASNAGNRYSDIWVDDLARAVRTRLTIDPDTDHGIPVWSPDGSRIAFAVLEGKIRTGIYQKHSNGAGGEELLLADSDRSIWPTSWSRDSRFLLYSREAARPEDSDIWVLPMAGDHAPRPFVQARARAYDGEFSPDGRWVAYTSEESGRGEVYVAPFRASSLLTTGPGPASAGAGGRWQVSASGGRSPRWRRDGKEIFYLSQANQIMAAEVEEKGNSMIVRAARALFRCTPVPSLPSSAPYDVSPDGQKFVINILSDDTQRLILLVNWTAKLK